jgi:deazaflavin-dependent oxidoreductase (nitroreductase family)
MGYIRHDGDYVIIGLMALFVKKNPGWFYNLESNPHALIQVNDRQIEVTAEMVGLDKREQVWAWVAKLAPFYSRFAKRTSREVPFVILHPNNG